MPRDEYRFLEYYEDTWGGNPVDLIIGSLLVSGSLTVIPTTASAVEWGTALTGSGIPTNITPQFAGQVYVDLSERDPYISNSIATGDWIYVSTASGAGLLPDHDLDDHVDVPPPSGSYQILEWDGTDYNWVLGPSSEEAGYIHDDLSWSYSPNFNGIISLLGWNIETDSAITLASGSPVTVSEPNFHTHCIINVLDMTPSGVPFTIRVSGTSIAELDGVTTSGDTEDLSVTDSGYYQTSKSWLDAVELSIPDSLSTCTADVYRTTYWDRGNDDFKLEGCRLEWEPDNVAWELQILIRHVHHNGEIHMVDSTAFANTDSVPRAANGKLGKYKRINYDHFIRGSNDEGLIIEIDQKGIRSFNLEVRYHV